MSAAYAPAGSASLGHDAGRGGLGARADAFALSVGSKLTVSTLMLACVLTIVVGAASMLDSLKHMDRDLQAMSTELGIAEHGLAVLNTTMNSLPPSRDHLHQVVATVTDTKAQIDTSAAIVTRMGQRTTKLDAMIGDISAQTGAMTDSLVASNDGAAQLDTTVGALDARLDPLVSTQHAMLGEVVAMQGGMGGMNGSLGYVIRTLDYMAQPPTGAGFTLRVALPKETLPPIPGVKVEADPVEAFPRGAWPQYTGP